jgi:Tfp pilus assembly protein PilF
LLLAFSSLTNIRENHDQTEAYYKKALKLEPDNATFNGNYALFLTKIHKKHDQAEKHYKKALELELPKSSKLLGCAFNPS